METDSDPADIRHAGVQLYPVGVSLEQAMAWIWKSRAFTGSGSSKLETLCCGPAGPIYASFSFPNSQSTSSVDAAKTKMSDLICLTSYVTDFSFFGTVSSPLSCGAKITTLEADCGFGFIINYPVIVVGPTPIYLYDDKYYIAIGYSVGGGLNFDEDRGATDFVGNLTIDGVNFPLYSPPDRCPGQVEEPTVASFSCTTTLEREAN